MHHREGKAPMLNLSDLEEATSSDDVEEAHRLLEPKFVMLKRVTKLAITKRKRLRFKQASRIVIFSSDNSDDEKELARRRQVLRKRQILEKYGFSSKPGVFLLFFTMVI